MENFMQTIGHLCIALVGTYVILGIVMMFRNATPRGMPLLELTSYYDDQKIWVSPLLIRGIVPLSASHSVLGGGTEFGTRCRIDLEGGNSLLVKNDAESILEYFPTIIVEKRGRNDKKSGSTH